LEKENLLTKVAFLSPEVSAWIESHGLNVDEIVNRVIGEYILKIMKEEERVQEREDAIRQAGIGCPFCGSELLKPERHRNTSHAVKCQYCHAFYWIGTHPFHWVNGRYSGICSRCGKEIWGDNGHANGKVFHIPNCDKPTPNPNYVIEQTE
jgi:DNA-directed RNA polymerase subunit RPC12/RpoP